VLFLFLPPLCEDHLVQLGPRKLHVRERGRIVGEGGVQRGHGIGFLADVPAITAQGETGAFFPCHSFRTAP